MNTPVTFPIAKFLKEKGFDKECNKYYEYALVSRKDKQDGFSGSFGWKKGELNLQGGFFINNHPKIDLTNNSWLICAAPTITDVIMWLYEKYGIWISIDCDCYGEKWYIKLSVASEKNWNDIDKRHEIISGIRKFSNEHNSPTEAYLAAIEYCLTKLI